MFLKHKHIIGSKWIMTNYILLTYKFSDTQYGEMSMVYAFIPFMNIIFTYGLETAFFRFANTNDKQTIYSTTSISIIVSTILLCFFHYHLNPLHVTCA